MAGRGPLPKVAGQRQRRNVRPSVELVRHNGEPPAPPVGLSKVWQFEWAALWNDPVASAIVAADLPALRRLFLLREKRDKAEERFLEAPTVAGSQGQQVLNPMQRVVEGCDRAIQNLEDRFGLNPQNRVRLGLNLGEAKRQMDDLSRTMKDDDDGDPRLEAL